MLVLTNKGGVARRVTISVSSAGGERYGPFDINARKTTEVEPRHFKALRNSGVLKIAARREDQEGRKYAGDAELELSSKAVRLVKLTATDAK